jgi:hypothetical protein
MTHYLRSGNDHKTDRSTGTPGGRASVAKTHRTAPHDLRWRAVTRLGLFYRAQLRALVCACAHHSDGTLATGARQLSARDSGAACSVVDLSDLAHTRAGQCRWVLGPHANIDGDVHRRADSISDTSGLPRGRCGTGRPGALTPSARPKYHTLGAQARCACSREHGNRAKYRRHAPLTPSRARHSAVGLTLSGTQVRHQDTPGATQTSKDAAHATNQNTVGTSRCRYGSA